MEFKKFIKECWGDIVLDVSIICITMNAFHLNIWQILAVWLLFSRVQFRILGELLKIRIPLKHMFEPVVKTELIANSIKEDMVDIKFYLFKKDLHELDQSK